MNKQITSHPGFSQQGVVLLESLIAILLFSVGVLSVVGLQAAMIKNTADSQYRATASFIAQQKIGQMWADPNNIAAYANTTTDISASLPGGLLTITQPVAAGQFTITVTWQKQGEKPHQYIAIANIAGG